MLDTATYLPILTGFETAVPYMYLDTTGKVTVGIGNMLPDVAAAQVIAFAVRPAPGSDPSIPPVAATAGQIATDFNNVSAQPKGFLYTHYQQFAQLSLTDDVITSLLNAQVQAITAQLVAAFPNYNSYPAEACAAIFDMTFNLGIGKLLAAFPSCVKAIRNADWTTAAAQCHRLPPISDDRNNWTQQQFLQAANDAAAAGTSGS